MGRKTSMQRQTQKMFKMQQRQRDKQGAEKEKAARHKLSKELNAKSNEEKEEVANMTLMYKDVNGVRSDEELMLELKTASSSMVTVNGNDKDLSVSSGNKNSRLLRSENYRSGQNCLSMYGSNTSKKDYTTHDISNKSAVSGVNVQVGYITKEEVENKMDKGVVTADSSVKAENNVVKSGYSCPNLKKIKDRESELEKYPDVYAHIAEILGSENPDYLKRSNKYENTEQGGRFKYLLDDINCNRKTAENKKESLWYAMSLFLERWPKSKNRLYAFDVYLPGYCEIVDRLVDDKKSKETLKWAGLGLVRTVNKMYNGKPNGVKSNLETSDTNCENAHVLTGAVGGLTKENNKLKAEVENLNGVISELNKKLDSAIKDRDAALNSKKETEETFAQLIEDEVNSKYADAEAKIKELTTEINKLKAELKEYREAEEKANLANEKYLYERLGITEDEYTKLKAFFVCHIVDVSEYVLRPTLNKYERIISSRISEKEYSEFRLKNHVSKVASIELDSSPKDYIGELIRICVLYRCELSKYGISLRDTDTELDRFLNMHIDIKEYLSDIKKADNI